MNSLQEIKDTVLSGTSVFYHHARNRVELVDGEWYVVHYWTDDSVYDKDLLLEYEGELSYFFTLTNTFR